MAHVAIIGSGVWGTAFGAHLASIGLDVKIWSRSQADLLESSRKHPLLKSKLPENIKFYDKVEPVVTGAKEIICMIPSSTFVDFLNMIKPYYEPEQIVLWGCKGWVKHTDSIYFNEVAEQILGKVPMAALSGPTFAEELAEGKPTAIVIASSEQTTAEDVMARFHGGSLRCYCSLAMNTVQFCGVYKNIIAVAAGISDGLALGANARSALITRGIAEMFRAAKAMGLETEAIMGLAGLGDVMLSATSDLSRNRKLGLALGQGLALTEVIKQPGMSTLESTKNVAMMLEIAKDSSIELPIAAGVYQVISGEAKISEIVENLLKRQPTYE